MKLGLQASTQSKQITVQGSRELSIQQKKPPGPRGLPIVGFLPLMGQFPERTMTKLAKKYGDLYQLRLGAKNVLILNGLETISQATIQQADDFSTRPDLQILKLAADGKTVGGKKYGQLWKRHREITQNALNIYSGSKSAIEPEVIQATGELVEFFLSQNGQPFDPESETFLTTGGIIYWLLFGDRKRSREDEIFLQMVDFGRGFVGSTLLSLMGDFLPAVRIIFKNKLEAKVHNAFNVLKKFASEHTEEHRQTYDPDNLRDMTDALLKAASELSESDRALGLSEEDLVYATIQESFGSGSDTLSTALTWGWLYMIGYPEFQAEVQAELDRVIGRERQVNWQDRKSLPFTEACIHEILRLSCYFPFGLPHATSADTTINGYFIPKDTFVMVNLHSLTRDERYWEEPEKFNPHRFLDKKGELIQDLVDKFYPFGIGKRRCLGEHLSRLEIFLFFANVLQKCKLEKLPGEKLSFEGVPGIVTHPPNYRVIATPRF